MFRTKYQDQKERIEQLVAEQNRIVNEAPSLTTRLQNLKILMDDEHVVVDTDNRLVKIVTTQELKNLQSLYRDVVAITNE